MRRKDREVTDSEKINQIIMKCECCRLGFADKEGVYIVPLNFGYAQNGDSRTFYFHGAIDGRKIDLIRQNGYAGFELDTNYKLNEADIPCDYSYRYQSVIGEGKVSLIEDDNEKILAVQLIMQHYSNRCDWKFTEAMLKSISVFKLEVKELSCKEHQ